MFKYTKDRISVLTVIDTRRPTKGGEYPIKVQVVHKRIQKYYLTGKEITIEDWSQLPKLKGRKHVELKESIENSFSLIRSSVEYLAEKGMFSFDALNSRLCMGAYDTLNNTFKAKISLLKKEDRIGTMLYYENILVGIESFAGKSVSFQSVTIDWLRRYEKFLSKDKNVTTIGMHMRGVRAIMNEAKRVGTIKETQYPFGKDKYQIQTTSGRKKALNKKQVIEVISYSDGTSTTAKYRDFWCFLYLCNGINVADMVRLKYSNIDDGEIYFTRQKTIKTNRNIKEIHITILPEIERIIEKWGNPDKNRNNFIFQCISEKDNAEEIKKKTKALTKLINKRLKMIGKKLNIGDVTTYTARHSYATILKREGANIAYISESLGHSDLKTTESYLASFGKEERQKNAELLLG